METNIPYEMRGFFARYVRDTCWHYSRFSRWLFVVGVLLGLILLFGACLGRTSADPIPIWTTYSTENSDLPNAKVKVLASGPDGALWAGTRRGLVRFDKEGHWQAYTNAETNGDLPDDYVKALAPCPDCSIWIGTSKGLTRLTRRNNSDHWETYTKASTNGELPDDNVSALAPEADGAIWIGTSKGLARRDNLGHWETYTSSTTNGRLPDDNVGALTTGSEGSIWIGTSKGLTRRDNTDHWETYSSSTINRGLPDDNVVALAPGTDGSIWMGTSKALARLDKGGHWQTYTSASPNDGLFDDGVNALAPDPDGAMWAGTGHGLAQFDKGGHWQTYTKTNGGLPDDYVGALVPGPDGALWAGSLHNLTRLDKVGQWQTYTATSTSGGLPDDDVGALVPGPDDALWAGTNHGLASLDKGGHWQTYTKASTNGELPDDNVSALAPEADGAIWIGTGKSLAKRDRMGNWQTYSVPTTNGNLAGGVVTVLALGADGAIWVGTSKGLASLDKGGHWQTYTNASTNGRMPDDNVSALASGADGAMWIGTGKSLAKRDSMGNWQTYSVPTTNGNLTGGGVTVLALRADGAIWVGTNEGLAQCDKEGHWQAFTDRHWQIYTSSNTNPGLPDGRVSALAPQADGAVWIGTSDGLARLDSEGHWQSYTSSNTKGGLPGDAVKALALGPDGTLWAGTDEGLGHLVRSPQSTQIVVDTVGEFHVVQNEQTTFAVNAFDRGYLTQPWMFHYVWRLDDSPETRTRLPFLNKTFYDDRTYRLRVSAVDIYGVRSEPHEIKFAVVKATPTLGALGQVAKWLLGTGVLYLALIFLLIPLYSRSSLARTAVNSGVFTKFPFVHKAILNTRWARRHLFHRLAKNALEKADVPNYIPQSVFDSRESSAKPLLDGSTESLKKLLLNPRHQMLIARSGTGKSVFLSHVRREMANLLLGPARRWPDLPRKFHLVRRFIEWIGISWDLVFPRGERVPTPLLIDLRTHVLKGRPVQELIRDVVRGAGLELADGDIDFMIRKGGFLVLIDSLNELPDPADAQLLHTFLNQDAGNYVLIASQLDLIRRRELRTLTLAELTPEQVRQYLSDTVGRDVYPELPMEAQALARNPQDLTLLAEVVTALGPAGVPTRRADLYREILEHDGTFQNWVTAGDPKLLVIYALAFQMVSGRRVLQDNQLRNLISSDPNTPDNSTETIVGTIRASRLFAVEPQRDKLGREILGTTFRHELIGKFLAARHVQRAIAEDGNNTLKPAVDYISLSGDNLWLDVFYFVIDEMDSPDTLDKFLSDILLTGGSARNLIAAYAIGTKPENLVSEEVRRFYESTKLKEDLARTPAAAV